MVYLANEDPEIKDRVAKQFGMNPDDVSCPWCCAIKGKCPVIPTKCEVYLCAEEKGVNLCCECSDFPCDQLHPYADKADSIPHNTKVFNLCLIKKTGLEEWAKEKAKQVTEKYFHDKWKM